MVDATVTGFTKAGAAELKVHEVLRGKPASTMTLKAVSLTCTMHRAQDSGLRTGKRYILLSYKDNLYEEGTFWEVTKAEDGMRCSFPGYRHFSGQKLRTPQMPGRGLYELTAFKKTLRSVMAGS